VVMTKESEHPVVVLSFCEKPFASLMTSSKHGQKVTKKSWKMKHIEDLHQSLKPVYFKPVLLSNATPWPSNHGILHDTETTKLSTTRFRLTDTYPTGMKHDVYISLILIPMIIYLLKAHQAFGVLEDCLDCHFKNRLLIKVKFSLIHY
jgi:hypothetical protein